MPLPHILPAMTVEWATYGFMAGFARQSLRWGGDLSALRSIVAGRIVFMGAAIVTSAAKPTIPTYLAAAMLPGLAAAVAQIGLLPLIAGWWVRRER